MIGAVPKLVIEMPKQATRGGLPRPPKIETHLPQRLQRRRQDGRDIVNLKSRHANTCSRLVARGKANQPRTPDRSRKPLRRARTWFGTREGSRPFRSGK